MSEKIYACVLRLIAPGFYRLYGAEATRLVRDRSRDERGVVGKVALWLDLLADLVLAGLRDRRFANQAPLSQISPAQTPNPAPSFAVIASGPPHTPALFIGGVCALGALAAFIALIGQGGSGRLASSFSPAGLHFSVAGRAVSQNSSLNGENSLVRTRFSGAPDSTSTSAGGSLALADAAALDAGEKKRVIDGVIANLREFYVYPNVARKMIDALLTHQKRGEYEKETGGSDFAALLTEHLQAVSHDRHLRLVYSAAETPPLGPPERDSNFVNSIKRDNCAFRKAELLPNNIGYLKFDGFLPVALCRDTAVAAMQFLAHADGLIFDLRENHGGDPHMVSFVASYLFDRRTHLNDIYTERTKSTEEFWTSPDVPGPRFASQPVYVLTSSETFSGGEEFTYDLKNLKRAVIVGETTGGGAHPAMLHRIDAHFTIGVPFARPINPISKTDWEGTGVTPDVKVKAVDALTVAERLALRKLRHKQE